MTERIKGFRDVYPADMAAHRVVIDTVEAVAQQYGFREIATPALERTELYVEKSGPEIVDELYAFDDQGGRSVALTPELTPTVARMVVAKQQELSKPIKWYSTRPFWRYEQVQQGRFREFYQTNVDIFGSNDPKADAEILAFAADALTALELTGEDFEFRVSHRDILSRLLTSFGSDVDIGAAIRAVDKRDSVEAATYEDELMAAGLTQSDVVEFDALLDAGSSSLDELTAFVSDPGLEAAVADLSAVLTAAEAFGIRDYCRISLDTARGLDYYTGVVFECFDTTGSIGRAIFGGGRYDDLIEAAGGPSMPAVGVAPGVMNSTLPLLLQRAGVWPGDALSTDYYVLTVGEVGTEAIDIAQELRAAGHVVEMDITGRSFGGQLEYADSIDAETVIIVGERDLAEGTVTIKDMTTGDQVSAPLDDVPGGRLEPRYSDYAE